MPKDEYNEASAKRGGDGAGVKTSTYNPAMLSIVACSRFCNDIGALDLVLPRSGASLGGMAFEFRAIALVFSIESTPVGWLDSRSPCQERRPSTIAIDQQL